MPGLSKHNDGINYLLNVIDVFLKYLHVLPLKSKTGPSVTSAFQTALNDPRYWKPIRKRPVWVQSYRGKEFSNRTLKDMLKCEGIQFHVCRNPEISAQSWNVLIENYEINCEDTLLRSTLTDSSMSYSTAMFSKRIQKHGKFSLWHGSGSSD